MLNDDTSVFGEWADGPTGKISSSLVLGGRLRNYSTGHSGVTGVWV